MARSHFVLTLLLFVFSWSVQAKEYVFQELSPGQEETFERSMIRKNISISEWFDGVADGLDLFLAGQRYTKKPNETSVTLSLSGYNNRFDGTSGDVGLNVDLRLPNVEEYWQLTFTSYDEGEDRNAKNRYLRQAPREKSLGASVGLFKRLGEVRTSFRPRITFEGTPAISHSLKIESIDEKKKFQINPEFEFYATPSKGAGLFQAINFHWEFTKVYSFTWLNEGDYQSRPHVFTVTHGAVLVQALRDRMSLAYSFLVVSTNRPTYELDSYTFSTTWNHIIYKKILDYRITPYLDFNQTKNFVGNPGISTTINLNF